MSNKNGIFNTSNCSTCAHENVCLYSEAFQLNCRKLNQYYVDMMQQTQCGTDHSPFVIGINISCQNYISKRQVVSEEFLAKLGEKGV